MHRSVYTVFDRSRTGCGSAARWRLRRGSARLGRRRLLAALQPRGGTPVREGDGEPEHEPAEEPQPGHALELGHQVDAQRAADERELRHERHAGGALHVGRAVRRRMMTPMLTIRNANSVPMLTSLAISVSGTKAANMDTSTPNV